MATALSEDRVGHSLRPSFFFWIAVVMSFFIFGDFSFAALERYLKGNAIPTPPVVRLHGAAFISWMTLLLAQTFLIYFGNVALHRLSGFLRGAGDCRLLAV